MQADAQARLDEVTAIIRKRFGADALRPLSEVQRVPTMPTGLPALDTLLGGGLPRGQISILYGAPSSGRTTLVQRIIAGALRDTGFIPYLDTGSTFDGEAAAQSGVDLERLLLVRLDDTRELLEVLGALITLRISPIVLDAGAARRIILPARLSALLAQASGVLLLLPPFGPPRSDHAGLRLLVERTAWLRQGRDITGCRVRVTVLENRFAAPGGSVELDLPLEMA